jgi:hypothetical protein
MESKQELMKLFDIKLFLPTSYEVAKARRFSRTPYMDPPHGTRQLGEMWKTEQYFNNVAWANYVNESAFMFENNNVEKVPFSFNMQQKGGVFMTPTIDASVEETVKWAVNVILCEIGQKVRSVRIERARAKEAAEASRVRSQLEKSEALSRRKRVKKALKKFKTKLHEKLSAAKGFFSIDRQGARDRASASEGRSGTWNTTILGTPLTPFLNAWRKRGSGNGFDGGEVMN